MDWYYAANGKQNGPVSDEKLEEMVRSGIVTAETLVWRDGLEKWTPYSSLGMTPAAPVAGGSGSDTAQCVECRQILPKSEMIAFEGNYICGSCKPLIFQRMREGVALTTGGLWRSKKKLVTSLNATLPHRCVKCNEATEGEQIKRKLYWHHPLVYLALVANIIIYAIIATCVRKKTEIFISVCPLHRAKRRNAILISWLLVLGGIILFVVGVAKEMGWLMAMGGIIFLGGIIYGINRGRLVYATKIDKENVWLAGCGPEFLSGLPEWSGPK